MKEELEKILRNFRSGANSEIETDLDQALTSIINLVDKELPEKKANALNTGGIVLSKDGKTVAISNLTLASSGGYNQAIDDMRAKLKGVRL